MTYTPNALTVAKEWILTMLVNTFPNTGTFPDLWDLYPHKVNITKAQFDTVLQNTWKKYTKKPRKNSSKKDV